MPCAVRWRTFTIWRDEAQDCSSSNLPVTVVRGRINHANHDERYRQKRPKQSAIALVCLLRQSEISSHLFISPAKL